MFINFFLKEAEQIFLGTLNVNNLIMVCFEKIEVPMTDDTMEYAYRLILRFNDIGEYDLFETFDLERLQAVHSAFCSVLSGGDTVFPLDNIGFIEPCYPPEAPPAPELAQENTRRTLSDK